MSQVVLLAGGKGTRLKPFSASFPKPLVPLGDKPVLEILIHRLKSYGFVKLTMAVGHLAPLIQAYFQDGSRLGVRIDYSFETKPLGTAGPLGLVDELADDVLVMNGDLLTDIDFAAFMHRHLESKSAVTVSRYRRDVPMDLGVLEVDHSGRLTGYVEKPTLHYEVSMGAYAFKKHVIRDYVPRNEHRDMPDLIRQLINQQVPVNTYLHDGFWLDVGRPDDYAEAQNMYEANSLTFLQRQESSGA